MSSVSRRFAERSGEYALGLADAFSDATKAVCSECAKGTPWRDKEREIHLRRPEEPDTWCEAYRIWARVREAGLMEAK